MLAAADALHARGKEATATAVLKHIRGEATRERREASRASMPIPGGMDLRIGDCSEVLANIPDNSVALILTDPPWTRRAEPLYEWLANFAADKLIPGGSMFCFVGKGWLDRIFAIFSARLTYCWALEMEHQQSRHYPRLNVKDCSTVVLWYSKGEPREGLVLTDLLPSPHWDKSLHEWSPGGTAVVPIIEARTMPCELVVDPFAGSGIFGRKAVEMGRRCIGADLARGGTTTVAA
jgi:hypothetical protein